MSSNPFKAVESSDPPPENTVELFNDLRKSDDIVGLWNWQDTILDDYHSEYEDSENVGIELPTGMGKTLVGLLIAEWRRRIGDGPVLYLCPTRQLARQVGRLAEKEYGIEAEVFIGSKKEFEPQAVQAYNEANRVGVAPYSRLFNISPGIAEPSTLVMDDAHVAENYVSGMWSLEVNRWEDEALYDAVFDTYRDALPSAFVERVDRNLDRPPRRGYELVHSSIFVQRLGSLRDAIDTRINNANSSDLPFVWDEIRDSLAACQLYISTKKVLIRPLFPPSLTHGHFSHADQRILMSATLGSDGNLERMTGLKRIERIEPPDNQAGRAFGRRLILFPDYSHRPDEYTPWLLEQMEEVGKGLVICRDWDTAGSFKERVTDNGLDLVEEDRVEDSVSTFLDADAGFLVVPSRFEGIDLPGESCRLLVLMGNPDAVNLQERFWLHRLNMKRVLQSRLRTRLEQAAGRCTRKQNDYSLVIPISRHLLEFCSQSTNRKGMNPELAAEIEFGLCQSGQDLEGFTAMLEAFLEQDEEALEQVEKDVEELRASVSSSEVDETDELLRQNAANEIEYQYRLWMGDLSGAIESARNVIDNADKTGINSYRAWWSYLTGATYLRLYEKMGESSDKASARKFFRAALGASDTVSWYGDLTQLLRKVDTEEVDATPTEGAIVEGIQDVLIQLGSRGPRFEEAIGQFEERLGKDDADDFEKALETLGEFLGWGSSRPNTTGAPDGIWDIPGADTIAFEVKTEKGMDKQIDKEQCLQAQGHVEWIRKNSIDPSDDIPSVLVTHQEEMSETATNHTEGLFIINPSKIRELGSRTIALLRGLRNQLTDYESESARQRILSEIHSADLSARDVRALLLGTPLEDYPRAD